MSISFSGARPYSPPAIRKYAIGYAILLAMVACWLIVPEIVAATGRTADTGRLAAALASLRGDLWARAANSAPAQDQQIQSWQISASRNALRLAPVDARSWLTLAKASLSAAPKNAAAQLKMSFYTGPAQDRLIPEYLSIISRLDVSSDDELQYLLERQIDKIFQHFPALRQQLATAYRETSSQNQILIEKLVSISDPAFAAALKAGR